MIWDMRQICHCLQQAVFGVCVWRKRQELPLSGDLVSALGQGTARGQLSRLMLDRFGLIAIASRTIRIGLANLSVTTQGGCRC